MSEWISVKDVKPKPETPYLILYCGIVQGETYVFDEVWSIYEAWHEDLKGDPMDAEDSAKVTDYYPLPSPPK